MHKKPMPLIFSADEIRIYSFFIATSAVLAAVHFDAAGQFQLSARWSLVGPKWQADRIIYDQR